MAKDSLVAGVRAQRLAEELEKAWKANPYASKTQIRKIAEEAAEKLPFDRSPIAIGKEAEDKAKRGP